MSDFNKINQADDESVEEVNHNLIDRGNNLSDSDLDINKIVGADTKAVLEYLVKSLVKDPDAVVIESKETSKDNVQFSLHVSPGDLGRVIGRQGRTAKALRVVASAIAHREGLKTTVDIVDQ
jgi:predicted RNA-binding protein YlqC (UPF0109 family)